MRLSWQRVLLMGIDVVISLAAVLAAFAIRFALDGRSIPVPALMIYVNALPIIVPIQLVVYHYFGLYRQMWAQASVPELIGVVGAVTVDAVATAVVILSMPHAGFPRSVIIIGWLLKLGGLSMVRLALRFRRYWHLWRKAVINPVHRTLIFGAGDAGSMLAREFSKHPELGSIVVGFIDDDIRKQGLRIAGKPVLGTRGDLEALVRKHRITDVIIAMPSVRGYQVREVVEKSQKLGLRVKTLPGLYELVNGTVSVTQIREIQIEDLLGRKEVRLDLDEIAAFLAGEIVLVTGAGGSIGSELCRQVSRFCPKQLLLLGHGENSIYEISLELRERFPDLDIQPIIADIQDEGRIKRVFERFRPGVVFHAAAHKHVPLMEQNPEEAIKNNVFGTWNVATAANLCGAKRFVLVSSDKAVNPTSVMGATKRAAEYIVQSLARTSRTIFVAVRFGNVLGSRGSVVPLFKRQIASGGPVTVTDERMVRYFMTIPEAAQLVIQAASMGSGGEIFVLDMGKPVRIIDLARDLIRLSGFEPDVDIPIHFTGIRQGEKLYEELLTAEEGTAATKHERIYVARSEAIPLDVLREFLDGLREAVETGRVTNEELRESVRDVLRKVAIHGAVGTGA